MQRGSLDGVIVVAERAAELWAQIIKEPGQLGCPPA